MTHHTERRRKQLRAAEKKYRKKRRIKRCRPTEPGRCPAARAIRDQLVVDLTAAGLLWKQTAHHAAISDHTVYDILRRARSLDSGAGDHRKAA